MPRHLREGFTTGTAAAAAAAAATGKLLTAVLPSFVQTALPPFSRDMQPSGNTLCIAVDNAAHDPTLHGPTLHDPALNEASPADTALTAGAAYYGWLPGGPVAVATVRKDGGDDPDATHGMLITAVVSLHPFTAAEEEAPQPVQCPEFCVPVTLYGGTGIGKVTLPGLPVAPGEPAINPQPRLQIAYAAAREADSAGAACALHIVLAAPEGVERAEKTLNTRLGILGGISILGTQGTVRPYSHEAWQATIRQGVSVAHAVGAQTIVFSTGRRSEKALMELYPGLPAAAFVQAADFAYFSIAEASGFPWNTIVWGCFAGKLLKLAQGLQYTHAKSARSDMALLAGLWQKNGGDAAGAAAVQAMPTAVGAFACMEERAPDIAQRTLHTLAGQALSVLAQWRNEVSAIRSNPAPALELRVFSVTMRLLATCNDPPVGIRPE